MEENAGAGKTLMDFELTYFERLRLAAQVILEAAPDLERKHSGLLSAV